MENFELRPNRTKTGKPQPAEACGGLVSRLVTLTLPQELSPHPGRSIQSRSSLAMSAAIQARAAKSSNAPGRAEASAEIKLTARQKRLIRESFLKLEPALDLVGQLFFLKLFRLDPALRGRFAGDPKTQSRKFMAAVKLTIISLRHNHGLAPTLKLLGVRQRQLGIKLPLANAE